MNAQCLCAWLLLRPAKISTGQFSIVSETTYFMILGIGIDLEESARIGDSIERFGPRFLNRVFTAGEIAFCEGKGNSIERFAARFAAKEAAFKALQASWTTGMSWRDFEITVSPSGAPRMVLHGSAAQLANSRAVDSIHVSFSHTRTHVTAIVVLEG